MITFETAMQSIEEHEKPSVLLGNGFSRAWAPDIFNYANLLDEADFAERDAQLRTLFYRLGTYDFEAVMRSLRAARTVVEAYGGYEDLHEAITRDQESLKNALIEAISKTHPERPDSVREEEYTQTRRFLSRFDQIFTVNYDLLLYWARNQDGLPPESYSTDDGFRACGKWRGPETDQQVHFLHGALHIVDRGSHVEKHSFSGTGTSIVDLVQNNLNKGIFPLFVAEPTAPQKKERIEHNPYLNYCFEALKGISGPMFIVGHSIDENEKHIFDQLRRSGVRKFFVSLFGDENEEANTRAKANARAYLESGASEVEFFSAESVPIWAQQGA